MDGGHANSRSLLFLREGFSGICGSSIQPFLVKGVCMCKYLDCGYKRRSISKDSAGAKNRPGALYGKAQGDPSMSNFASEGLYRDDD